MPAEFLLSNEATRVRWPMVLNLNDDSLRPCDKSDDIIQYINKEFNHPPNLIKHLPVSIENNFQTILSIKKYFKNQLFIMKIH